MFVQHDLIYARQFYQIVLCDILNSSDILCGKFSISPILWILLENMIIWWRTLMSLPEINITDEV